MAYSQNTGDHEIWSLEHGREPVRSRISSTFIEACPQFSHDGNRIAFLSARSGNAEIWVANLDGTDAVQLTNSKASGNPRWSPDDKWIVYETQSPDGGWDIRMIDPTGGPPIGVVHHPANEMQPSFSQDGKWIYFRSNRGGTDEVYRVPFGGGDAVQLTDHGGIAPVESADGKTLFYSMGSPQCENRMFARPLAGGPERRILDSFCVAAITGQGIYFIPKRPAGQTLSVWFLDSATGETREFRKIMGRLHTFFGMTVSPDGRIILVAASAQSGADLHLVENFR